MDFVPRYLSKLLPAIFEVTVYCQVLDVFPTFPIPQLVFPIYLCIQDAGEWNFTTLYIGTRHSPGGPISSGVHFLIVELLISTVVGM
jgi:hypothetical protein